MTNRPQGMSQLDYLWTHFGAYEVSNEASQVPSENIILTEQALANFLQETTSGGITRLTYRKHPTKEGIMQLIGTSANGSELTIVEMPEEVHVQSFQRRKITQEDIDNGFDYPIDSDILSIILTNGQELIVSMMDLDLMISSKDTSTIHTEIVNGVISSTLRIDSRNNDNSIIPIYNSGNGIYADIKVSKTDSGVEITKETDGLSACIPINGSKLRFKTLKLDQYLVLEPKDATTLYIITDIPYIYFGGVRYGSGLETSDSPIVSITYDADHMLFSYKKVGEDITQIHLGPADENTPGMMSTESYVDLQNLKNKLGDLNDIPEYIENQVGQLAYSLELGEQHNNIRPLILKAKNGGILSTVNLDVENFLQEAENKIADAQDVIDSGETVQEGHQILILTLTSGDKVYVDLNALVTAYTVGNTDTIELNLNNNNFTANLKINGNEKMIHSDSKGIQTYWSVVQDQNTVTFYGKDQTLEYKLGQIIVPDALQGYQFIGQITSDNVIQYPPRTVDGIDYDYESNPVIIGDPYIILTYGETTKYYDYISINPILQVIGISPKEYNAITKDDQGLLYSEDRSIVSGELTDGILTIQLSNNTNIIIPIPEATKEQSGLLSSEDKSKLETILGDGDESIYSMQEELDRLKSDVNNIGNVIIPEMIPLSQKGSVNGVASLDENGKVPSTQLPGFVDDVLEYDNFEAFPETGETGKIYVTKDTNLEYRWSGTQYTQISKSVGIGETSSTAYAGDKGKQVTDRVAEIYGANSVINGLSDIIFDSDNIEAQTLSADNAIKTWDSSNTLHDLKIPYATTTKAGVMSAADKTKLDLVVTDGDGTQFLADDGTYKEVKSNNVYVLDVNSAIEGTPTLSDEEYNKLVECINTNGIILLSFQDLILPAKYNTNGNIYHINTEVLGPEGRDIVTTSIEASISVDKKIYLDGGTIRFQGKGDGTQFLSDDGTYKTIDLTSLDNKYLPLTGGVIDGALDIHQNLHNVSINDGNIYLESNRGIIISTKDSSALLNAAGSTSTLKTINGQSLIGTGDITIEGGTDTYVLPIASDTALGGIKIGTGLNISEDGTVTVNIPTDYVTNSTLTTTLQSYETTQHASDTYQVKGDYVTTDQLTSLINRITALEQALTLKTV